MHLLSKVQQLMQDQGVRLRLQNDFQHIDAIVAINTGRMADAIRRSSHIAHPAPYDSMLDQVVAQVMGTDAAVASMRLLSGVPTPTNQSL